MRQRETVVLLHSSASSARQWQALAEQLRPQFRVHAIDLHGHGERPGWRTDAALTLADEAALAAPLLAGGAHLIGHSYGGAVALKLTSMYPHLVRSVVAYEPVMFGWLQDEPASLPALRQITAVADAMCEHLWDGDEHAAAQSFVDFWSGTGAWNSLSRNSQTAIAARMRVVIQQFDALFNEPLQPAQLASLRVPMMFMTGARTVLVAQHLSALLRRNFSHAEHQTVAAAGHMGPITHTAEVNRRLVEFLDANAEESALRLLSEAA